MSTSTTQNSTGEEAALRPSPRSGEHVVAVRFGAWGPQEVAVRAYSNAGRGGAPCVVVQVGMCLTYAYDQAAIDSHVTAWQDAEWINRSVRLPELVPASASRRHAGEDLSVLCNVSAAQRRAVTGTTGPDGRPLITVAVGAVAVDVHTTTALRSYLAAWRKAATVTGLLEDSREDR